MVLHLIAWEYKLIFQVERHLIAIMLILLHEYHLV